MSYVASGFRRTVLMAFIAIALGPPALAHHSYAAFDRTKEMTVTGVVKEFQWNNPHAWIQVTVTDGRGRQTEWGLECGSPNMMARTGWKRTTLKVGEPIAVTGYLARLSPPDGPQMAIAASVTAADGRALFASAAQDLAR